MTVKDAGDHVLRRPPSIAEVPENESHHPKDNEPQPDLEGDVLSVCLRR